MKLYEFEPGTQITICSKKAHSHYEYQTTILDTVPLEERIVTKPVEVQGHFVNFSNAEVEHMISVNVKSKVYIFPNVKISNMKTLSQGYKFALNIVSKEDVNAVNRRNFFRVYMGIGGELQPENSKHAQEVLIKDISANGLGVICPRKLSFPIGTNVTITFIDELKEEEFSLDCIIVREVVQGEEKILYGCQLPEVNDSMEKLVAFKQRMR